MLRLPVLCSSSIAWLHYCCALIMEVSCEVTYTKIIYPLPGLHTLQSVREQYL